MISVGTTGTLFRDSRRARGLVLCFVLSVALAGCKPRQDSSGIACDREAYIAQSGVFSPTAGEGLTGAKSHEPIAEAYFEKPFNQDWLKAVGRASIVDTIAYIQTTGARVYRADPISPKSTPVLRSAAPMPQDLDREWRKADRPSAGSECGFLTGLYIGSESQALPSVRGKAAIIVREDAGRWTLVHEFMHHNFKTQAAIHGFNDDVTQNLRLSLYDDIARLKKNRQITNREYAQRLSILFQQLIDVADQMVLQYQFEEITIEATLQDHYERGDLAYVSPYSFENATFYIDYAKKNVIELYKGMTGTYDELFRLTSTNGLLEDLRKLGRYVTLRDHRLAQLDEVIAKRLAHGYSPPKVADSFIAIPKTGFAPCAQAQAVEDEMLRIAALLRTPR